MGLDITAYEKSEKAAGTVLEEIMADPEPICAAYDKDYDIPWINDAFPGREEGVERVPYRSEKQFDFRAGSYSGYNWWRRQLARMVGITNIEVFWKNPDMTVPFAELINFADNEGTIGPIVSKKLADDFREHDSRAVEFAKTIVDSSEGEYWLSKYREWTKAFTMAANDGYVSFH